MEAKELKKIQIFNTIDSFEEFINRADIEVMQVDVKVVEQSSAFQQSFAAVVYYRMLIDINNGTRCNGAVDSDPSGIGYYLTRTEEDRWGIVYWDGSRFWFDDAQDGKLRFGVRRSFITEWYSLPSR